MARIAKIKAAVSYTGKGKKNPTLPEGVDGALTIVQGESVDVIAVRTAVLGQASDQPQPLFLLTDLVQAFGLKVGHAKNLTLIGLATGAKGKLVSYATTQQAILLAATGRTVVGATPAASWFLGAAFAGSVERLTVEAPALFPTAAVAE